MHTKTPFNASACLLALVCATCLLGCKDSRRRQSTDALTPTTSSPALPADASPEQVVLQFLEIARGVQHIRATGFAEPGRQKAYDEGMSALQALTNGPQLLSNMLHSQARNQLPAGITQDAAITTATESWVSILAHYIDGLQVDDIRLVAGGAADDTQAEVRIQGEDPDEVAAVKALEGSPDIKGAKDAAGNPIKAGTPEYQTLVSKKALDLDPPIALPLRATFSFVLARSAPDKPWGIVHLRIIPTSRPMVHQNLATPAHTTLPTS